MLAIPEFAGGEAGARRSRPDTLELEIVGANLEQDYRELKDELGVDHYEGRSWPGWHHHVTLAPMFALSAGAAAARSWS